MNSFNMGGVPTIGSLFGTVANIDVINSINTELDSGNFFNGMDDWLSAGRKSFMENVVYPVRELGYRIKSVIGGVLSSDAIIPITSEDQLKIIPTAMHFPILQYAPIKKLFDEGRIFGFGYEYVPDDDPYGRLIKNGTIEDISEAIDENSEITLNWEFHSEDPDLTFEELDSIEETRLFIDKFLAESDRDPTDYENRRG